MVGQAGPIFPQEIWWLVAQELANRRDLTSLFLCARLGRSMARLALPELYAIHDQSPAINAHILDIEAWICLWRSIISSSLGKTLFPYCCWIKALMLSNLHSQLDDLNRYPKLKAQFFSPPLEKIEIHWEGRRELRLDAIITEVASMVTDCIRTSAENDDRRAALTTLEGDYLPTANLPTWISGLSNLTSLSVRVGSVLNSNVALAIRANCPAFREVECYSCIGPDVDHSLAGFLRNLEPNTLVSFTILSANEIGRESFKALCEHSGSLKTLGLLSLERPAFESLDELQHCVSLESLRLEGAFSVRRYLWKDESKQVFKEAVQWLHKCTHLRELVFTAVPSATTFLAEVLTSPTIRLTTLSLLKCDRDQEFCTSLIQQQQLRNLAVKIRDEELLEADEADQSMLANAVASCHELRELDSNELFSVEDIEQICSSRPYLEFLGLNGDLIEDVYLAPISRLSRLKSLIIYGPSIISPEALLEFLETMATDPEGEHKGLQVWMSNQNYDYRFPDEQANKVAAALRELFSGRFDITYRMDPDELHESDFSD